MNIWNLGRSSLMVVLYLSLSFSASSKNGALLNKEISISYDSSITKIDFKEGDTATFSGSICFNKKKKRKGACKKISTKKYDIVATFPDSLTPIDLNLEGNKKLQFNFEAMNLNPDESNQFSLAVVRKGHKNSLSLLRLRSKVDYRVNLIAKRIDLYQAKLDLLKNSKRVAFYKRAIAFYRSKLSRVRWWKRGYYRYKIWRYKKILRREKSRSSWIKKYYTRKIKLLSKIKKKHQSFSLKISQYLEKDPDLYARIDIPLMVEGQSSGKLEYNTIKSGYRFKLSIDNSPFFQNESKELHYSLIPIKFGKQKVRKRDTFQIRLGSDELDTIFLKDIAKEGYFSSRVLSSLLPSDQVNASIENRRGKVRSMIFLDLPILEKKENNLPAMLGDQNFEVDEDDDLSFTLSGGSDSDGDTLTYKIVSNPQSGNLSNCLQNSENLTCSFIADENFNGVVSFSYVANDGKSDAENPSTVTITVKPINDAPILSSAQSFIGSEDNIFNFTLLAGSDLDGDDLTYFIVSSPVKGTITNCLENNNDLTCSYTPAANESGVVTFTYKANDGEEDSNISTVSLDILALNDRPVMIGNQHFETNEDTPFSISLNGAIDSDGDTLSYRIISNPISGAISNCLQNNNDLICTYTPSLNFSGTTSFSYIAKDQNSDAESPAIVTITIHPINDVPTLVANQSFSGNEDEILNFSLAIGSDSDGDALSYSIVSVPSKGDISNCLAGNGDLTCSYTPAANESGTVTFTYKANDGKADSNISTVRFDILAVNDRPTMAGDQNFEVDEDSPLLITLSGATDIDGDTLTYKIVSNPTNGTISNCLANNNDLTCDFLPAENFNGEVIFSYIGMDGDLEAALPSKVTILVKKVNDAPTLLAEQEFFAVEDQSLTFTLAAGADLDGDNLTYSIVSGPSTGVLSGCAENNNDLECTYTPKENEFGKVTFQVKANDGIVDSNISTVSLDISAVNDRPVMAGDQNFEVDEDSPLSITLSGATDIDGDTLTYKIVSNPTNGTISNCLANNNDLLCDFLPAENFNGEATFSYIGMDGDLEAELASKVTILVNKVNDAPTLLAEQEFSGVEDQSLTFSFAAGIDLDGDSLTYSIVSGPSTGVLSGCAENNNDLECTYTPSENEFGKVTFQVKANDGTVDSNISTISLDILAVNDRPVMIGNQNFETDKNKAFSFNLSGASDIDGDTLTYKIVSAPENGTLTDCLENNNDLSCAFSPDLNFTGTINFSYIAIDQELEAAAPSIITIEVKSTNSAPILISFQSFEGVEDQDLTFSLATGSDSEGDSLTYSIVSAPSVGELKNCLGSTNTLDCTYTPVTDESGTITFSYKANDGNLDSEISIVTLDIKAFNDSPVLVSEQSFTTDEDIKLNFILASGSDVESDPLTYEIVAAPENGILSGCLGGADLSCQFTPNENFSGEGSFSYRVFDGNSFSEISNVKITISAINDTPILSASQNFEGNEDSDLVFTLETALDPDSTALNYELVTNPTNGTLSECLNNNNDLSCKFIPSDNFSGTIDFTYRVSDGNSISELSNVSLNILPVNDIPELVETQTFEATSGLPFNFNLKKAIDIDGDDLTYTLVSSELEDAIINCLDGSDDLSCSFNPDENLNGEFFFEYRANDGKVNSNNSKVKMVVNSLPDQGGNYQAFFYHVKRDRENTLDLFYYQSLDPLDVEKAEYIIDGTTIIPLTSFYHRERTILRNLDEGIHDIILSIQDRTGKQYNYSHQVLIGSDDAIREIPAFVDFDVFQVAPKKALIDYRKIFTKIGFNDDFDGLSINWGDGNIDDDIDEDSSTMFHEYNNIGTYTVSFTAANFHGVEETISKEIIITNEDVAQIPPIIDFRIFIEEFAPHVTFNLDLSVSPTNSIASVVWDHGDGTTYTGVDEEHTHFYGPGVYLVSLTVTDDFGMQAKQTQRIVITNPGPPVISYAGCEQKNDKRIVCEIVAVDDLEQLNEVIINWGDGTTESVSLFDETFIFDAYEHLYDSYGNYNLTLSVKTFRGENALFETNINIENDSNQAPIVDFFCRSHEINELICDASNSFDSDGFITQYHFDYGDGEQIGVSSQLEVLVGSGGLKNITLTIYDNEGKASERMAAVFVRENQIPDVQFICSQSGGFSITCDASATEDLDGDIISYEWDFGDGEKEMGQTVEYSYQNGGNYIINLNVKDAHGASVNKSQTLFLNSIPIAKISCTSPSPLTLDCDGGQSSDPDGNILVYTWSFNGEGKAGVQVSHTFSDYGDVLVSLKVTDPDGRFSESFYEHTFVNSGAPPLADFQFFVNHDTKEIFFDSSRSLNGGRLVTKYDWKFNKGDTEVTTATDIKISKVYSDYGEKEITLTVTDSNGQTSSITKNAIINNFPVPDPGSPGKIIFSGIDSDADGLRDDIQRYIIFFSGGGEKEAALIKVAKSMQKLIENVDDKGISNSRMRESIDSFNCYSLQEEDKERRKKVYNGLKIAMYNTKERFLSYMKTLDNFAGEIVSVELDPTKQQAACN